MHAVALVILAGRALCVGATVSGHVATETGAPIANAEVFLEQDLLAALRHTLADDDGAFAFEDVAPGVVGVFAVAEDCAFGGVSVIVAAGDETVLASIVLGRPGTVVGMVVDAGGEPVAGARVMRVVLLGDAKVGLPLTKLDRYGYDTPRSDKNGRFELARLPQGATAALKMGHPDYAQQVATDVTVGQRDVRVALRKGVLLHGAVTSRSESAPVANAFVMFRNTAPPHDSAVAATDAFGLYGLRLNPGEYIFRATGPSHQSATWERVAITDEREALRLDVKMAGVGRITGEVRDAVSGEPIADAKVVLEALGGVAAVARTGSSGSFRLEAAAGETIITLEPAPGYLPREDAALRVHVVEGETATLPTFWLAPVPTYSVQIIDGDESARADAVVTVLRPAQMGLRATDRAGRVDLRIASMPGDGTIVGMAEHLREPLGALFSLTRDDGGKTARVRLFAFGRVGGRVVGPEGKGAEGAVVAGLFQRTAEEDPVVLWRTVSRKDGRFAWPAATAHVPQRCAVFAGESFAGRSASFVVSPGEAADAGEIVVVEKPAAGSLHGAILDWRGNTLLCGEKPEGGPVCVVYCPAAEAAATIETVESAGAILGNAGVKFAVVVDGAYACDTVGIPVFSGSRPGAAATYVVDASGKVVLETFGLPPANAAVAFE